jgi:hypothetical protein
MTKPVFLNDKSFPVQVGTPSGTGRTIQPGFAVEGDYFSGPVSRGMPLRRLSTKEAEAFDKQKIVMSLSSNSPSVQSEVARPYPIPEQVDIDTETVPPVHKPAPDAVNKTMEESLNVAMKEMGTQIPTLAELKNMNMQQLNAAAIKHGVSKANGRTDIINQLAAKLSL